MSRVNGEMEVDRGSLIWSYYLGPAWNMSEVDTRETCKYLEKIQENFGRKLVGGSSTVAGFAVRGDLGWRKQEERREEKKLLFGRMLVAENE